MQQFLTYMHGGYQITSNYCILRPKNCACFVQLSHVNRAFAREALQRATLAQQFRTSAYVCLRKNASWNFSPSWSSKFSRN